MTKTTATETENESRLTRGLGEILSPVNTRFLKVGEEMFAVYGDPESGWSLQQNDLQAGAGKCHRYRSIEELYFALANLSISPCGSA